MRALSVIMEKKGGITRRRSSSGGIIQAEISCSWKEVAMIAPMVSAAPGAF